MTGDQLTRWTVRLAVACYFAVLCLRVSGMRHPAALGALRWTWTLGCALFLAHVALAFHVFHGWSHDHAYAETARQTEEMTGTSSGWGLYLNYLFTAVWAGDVAYAWTAGASAYVSRARWIDVSLHAFMLFMVINGAIVFETGVSRTIGIAGCAAVVVAWVWGSVRNRTPEGF